MEKEPIKYENFVKDWNIDNEKMLAIHNTGLGILFASNLGKNIDKVYENYIPWRREMFKSGLNEKDIDQKVIDLSFQFDEICRHDFLNVKKDNQNQPKKTKCMPVSDLCNFIKRKLSHKR